MSEHVILGKCDILFRIVIARRWIVVFYRHPKTYDLGFFWGRGDPFVETPHPLREPGT